MQCQSSSIAMESAPGLVLAINLITGPSPSCSRISSLQCLFSSDFCFWQTIATVVLFTFTFYEFILLACSRDFWRSLRWRQQCLSTPGTWKPSYWIDNSLSSGDLFVFFLGAINVILLMIKTKLQKRKKNTDTILTFGQFGGFVVQLYDGLFFTQNIEHSKERCNCPVPTWIFPRLNWRSSRPSELSWNKSRLNQFSHCLQDSIVEKS